MICFSFTIAAEIGRQIYNLKMVEIQVTKPSSFNAG